MVAISRGLTHQQQLDRREKKCAAEQLVVNVENQAGQGAANTSKSLLKVWQRRIVAKVMPMTQRSLVSSANSSEKAHKASKKRQNSLNRDPFVT